MSDFVRIHVSGVERTSEEFKSWRRQTSRDITTIMQEAGTETVLPTAKSLAPRFIAPTLVVRKGRSNSAYLTTTMRGKKGRVVGLLEMGGTVRKAIRPTKAHMRANRGKGHAAAVKTPWGPRAAVYGDRTYKAKAFMRTAVRERLPTFTTVVERRIMDRYHGETF